MHRTLESIAKSVAQELFQYIKDLREQLLDTDSELQDKRDANKAVRSRLIEVQNELSELSGEKVATL